MLFGTGPSAGSVGPAGPHPYSPYSHASAVATGPSLAPSFKSLHPALMNSMLHVTSPNPHGHSSQSELIASLNTYHHHHNHHQPTQPQQPQLLQHPLDSSMSSGVARNSADNASKASVGNSPRESPGTHRTQTASPSSSSGGTSSVHHGNQNEVRTCMLYGIPIVSLVMDGQERLCLAQISNTLLKSFSYNEIHNRRVALGITCVQCTPVQLELLRRAGAMPVSSRRCGMITKRESERLCKSFLAEAEPPKLPDSFAFDVYHSCAWGCRGSFTPSRYNSSRAKCIKCIYCGLFFSPNKFIFHSHRLPTSKYIQPDAANFNSWRRHIRLVNSPEPPEHVSYAWEDVKAMFNGGSRKRAMSSTLNSFTKNQESNSKANAASKHEQARYKYSDDNSGLEDSDDYSSLDGAPQASTVATATSHPQPMSSKKIVLAGGQSSNDSDQGNNSGSQLEEMEQMNSPPLHCMNTAAAATAIHQHHHHHPYHPFAQMNSKSIFESHFKKAFEINSAGSCQAKSMEAEMRKLEQTGNHSPPHITSSPLVSTPPPIMGKHQASAEPSTTTDHSSISKTAESMMMHSPPFSSPSAAATVLPPAGHAAYLAAAAAAAAAAAGSEQTTLMANYNGLFGGHPFSQRTPAAPPPPPSAAAAAAAPLGQLSDSRLHSSTHPAILSTLLNGMPETAMTATQQLRAASGLLSSGAANYMPMAPSMMAANQQLSGAGSAAISANSTIQGSDLTGPPPVGVPSSTDFRHNLAEFMWSMAASKAGPTPYSFFWPHAAAAAAASAVHPPPHPAVMSAAPLGSAGSLLASLGTTNTSQTSSSTSSTPTLSPNHLPSSGDTSVNLQEVPSTSNGGLFGHFSKSATANADDIRKALLLNSGLLHQQHQRNVAAHFPQLHPNVTGMPFLPNLIGHNLRLMPPNHSTPSYLLNKENTQVENGLPLQNKSPEMHLSSTSSQSLPPTSLPFSFRSAFTSPLNASGSGGAQRGSTALDRFSSEALLRNQALLFDAYHSGGSTARAATFFNPGLFSGSESSKQCYEEGSARDADKAEKAVDVFSGENGETASMFRSMHHSFSTTAKTTVGQTRLPANGSTKFSRRNLKRYSSESGVSSNKKASSSSKGKPSPKKGMKTDHLPIFEVSSVELTGSEPNGKNLELTVDGSGSCRGEVKKTEELQQNHNCNPEAEIVCDVEEGCSVGVESLLECQSSSKSSPSPNPSQCSPSSLPVMAAEDAKVFPPLGDTVSPASQSSPSTSSGTNQTAAVVMQLVL